MEIIPIDIRLICATNVSLAELAMKIRFSKDLIYRYQYGGDNDASLRKRGVILFYWPGILRNYTVTNTCKITPDFDKKAMEKLLSYNYPAMFGNYNILLSVQ